MPIANRLYAEFLGTAWLVLGGCGSAVLAAAFPQLGIGFLGVALAFGLTVLTMVYALGPVSGGHFNPAVTVGLAFGGRFPWNEVVQYVIAQVLGGIVGAAILYVVATGKAGADIGSFATNGYGEHSGHQYLGEPRAQHGAGAVRGRRGAGAALAVLGGADNRRGHRRPGLQAARPQGLTRRACGGKVAAPVSLGHWREDTAITYRRRQEPGLQVDGEKAIGRPARRSVK